MRKRPGAQVVKIGTRVVGPGYPTFIIAECGSNHGGSLADALTLIDAAARAGADAAKFQYFRVDRFLVPRVNPDSLRKYELPDEWLPKLKAACEGRGIEFLCTAFDVESLRVVAPFVNAFKIGSYEAFFYEFIEWAKRIEPKMPIIASEGRARHLLVDVAMRCVSEYPAPIRGYLRGYDLPQRDRMWGVSDHTLDPLIVPCAAVALGACVVEKHFKRHSITWTPDSAVSIEPEEFTSMVRGIRATESAIRG